MDYDNTNSGVLFKNDKEGNENRPDYKGKINVNGVDMDLAAWIKTSSAGNKYMSLKASEPRQQEGQSTQQAVPDNTEDDAPLW